MFRNFVPVDDLFYFGAISFLTSSPVLYFLYRCRNFNRWSWYELIKRRCSGAGGDNIVYAIILFGSLYNGKHVPDDTVSLKRPLVAQIGPLLHCAKRL